MKLYLLFYRKRSNPQEWGDGRPVHNEKDANHICRESNRMFPEYEHWYETVTT